MTITYNRIIYNEKPLQGKFCSAPWTDVSVFDNGRVTSCICPDWTSVDIGNLLYTSLEEIYTNSVNLFKIRQSVIDGNYGWCKIGHCSLLNNLPDAGDNPWTKFQINQKPKLPRIIRLGLDETCNLQCRMCRNKLNYSREENPKITQILESLIESYKDHDEITEVICDGAGEVFASKSYEKILWSGRLPKCWKIGFLTNGNLISKRKNQLREIKDNISDNFGIQVSLDASTPEVYKKMRGGDFQVVLDGLDTLKELDIKFHLEFVLQAGNYKDLEGYHGLGKKYDVFHSVQHIDRKEHMSSIYWDKVKLEDNPDIDYDYLKKTLKLFVDNPNSNVDGGIQELIKSL